MDTKPAIAWETRHERWPTRQLRNLLEGRVAFEDAQPAIQSWAAFYFYDAAKQIVAMGDLDERREALAKIPEGLRGHVQKEILRLWEMRKKSV